MLIGTLIARPTRAVTARRGSNIRGCGRDESSNGNAGGIGVEDRCAADRIQSRPIALGIKYDISVSNSMALVTI